MSVFFRPEDFMIRELAAAEEEKAKVVSNLPPPPPPLHSLFSLTCQINASQPTIR